MPPRLEPRLALLLEALAKHRPTLTLPFIVTLAPGAQASEVVPFAPTLAVEITRMVAGEMTATQALDLARHAQVEMVEFDGQAHAIQALLDAPG